MWILKEWWRRTTRSDRQWQLFYGEHVFECFIVDHPAGVEIRFQYRGDPYHERVYPRRADAERESHERRRQMVAAGWSERPARTAAPFVSVSTSDRRT